MTKKVGLAVFLGEVFGRNDKRLGALTPSAEPFAAATHREGFALDPPLPKKGGGEDRGEQPLRYLGYITLPARLFPPFRTALQRAARFMAGYACAESFAPVQQRFARRPSWFCLPW